MRKLFIAMAMFVICGVLGACGKSEGETSSPSLLRYTDITPEEAKKRLDSDEDILLVDVRTYEEYVQQHIPDSILIPVDQIERQASEILTDKDAEVFVYCRSGRRSIAASETLIKMGYTRIYNLGGMNDWPYDTVSGK